MKKSVLISVFNKVGLIELATNLSKLGYEIIATDGTGKELNKNNLSFIPAQEITNNPSILKDCIQTISFRIQAGILFSRSNPVHKKDLKKLNIPPIEIVVCNFPPIKSTLKSINDFNIQHVDVGGPLMVRAAATNFKDVLVIIDHNDYKEVIQAINENKLTIKFRQKLAIKAFNYTQKYDNDIIKYLKNNDFYN